MLILTSLLKRKLQFEGFPGTESWRVDDTDYFKLHALCFQLTSLICRKHLHLEPL